MTELITQPEASKRPCRLRCRFKVDAAPSHPHLRRIWLRALEKMKYRMAERFIKDMARQGWEYLDKHGIRMTGPYTAVTPVDLRHYKRRHFNAQTPVFGRNGSGPELAVVTLPPLAEADHWEYELAAVFLHKRLLVEVPDAQEEKEMLNKP